MGKRKKVVVAYTYNIGMMVVLGVKPISRIIEFICDNKQLVKGPFTGGYVDVDRGNYFSDGKIRDGIDGRFQMYLNGTHGVDEYLRDYSGMGADLTPTYQEVAYIVMSDRRRSGPFYIGNSPNPREMRVIAERTETTCPFGSEALLPYTHDGYELELNDFNPLVIYWELLIKGYESEYGDTFAEAAAVLKDEGFGIWYYNGGGNREAIQSELERYVNGRTYIDRQTGLREFKLIRDDYDYDDLVVIGEEDLIVDEDPDIVFPRREMAFNTFTVNFTDRYKNFEAGSITVQDLAHAAAYGVRRGEPLDYKWVTNRQMATNLGMRDVRAQTSAGVTGAIKISGLRPDIHEGSTVRINLPTWNVFDIAARVLSIEEAGPLVNAVMLRFTEDVFGASVDIQIVDDGPDLGRETAMVAEPATIVETPYWLGLKIVGDEFADAVAQDPAESFIAIMAGRQGELQLGYNIFAEYGTAQRVRTGEGTFCSFGFLDQAINRHQTTIRTSPIRGLVVGDVIMVTEEFMRVDAIDDTDAVWVLTVGRGCIDTAPTRHIVDEPIYLANQADTDGEGYTSGDYVEFRLQTFTFGDTLEIDESPYYFVNFGSRAARPYPPGNFMVDGSYADGQIVSADIELTWSHRDRLLQVDESYPEDHTEGDIGPEDSVYYLVGYVGYDQGGSESFSPIEVNVSSDTDYTIDFSSIPPGTAKIVISVTSARPSDIGTLRSYTSPEIYVYLDGYVEETTSSGLVETTEAQFVELS